MKKIDEVSLEPYDSNSPLGSDRDGFTTFEEETDSPLARGVLAFLVKQVPVIPRWEARDRVEKAVAGHPLEFTTHHCWSGYSEYTVTSTWDEMSFKWGEFEHHFESMGKFFTALAEADVDE